MASSSSGSTVTPQRAAAPIAARFDPALAAIVTSRHALRYYAGADAAEDRPGHVRAGSGLAWMGRRLAIVSDDANFVSLVDPETGRTEAVPLPRGAGERRLFDDATGNKADKLDLESCCAVTVNGTQRLLSFGSGSTPKRERVAVVEWTDGVPCARLVDASTLYAALRAERRFSGSELNVEGVAVTGGVLRLFQRGNGEARGELRPVNATVDVSLAELLAYLAGERGAPELRSVTPYELGAVDGTPLTFTDGASAPGGRIVYLAAAEASPDAVRDGPVAGSVVGIVDADGARQARLVTDGGAPFVEKAEGLVLDPRDPELAYIVVDADDATRPSELCTLRLAGDWFSAV